MKIRSSWVSPVSERANLSVQRKRPALHEDAIIAATATAAVCGLTVASRNSADFKPFKVKLLDPFKPARGLNPTQARPGVNAAPACGKGQSAAKQ